MIRQNKVMMMVMTALSAVMIAGIAVVQAQESPLSQSSGKATAGPAQIGDQVADFTLTDTDGKEHTLSDYLEKHDGVVLEWFNPDCPYVKKYHVQGNPSISEAAKFAAENDFVWLAVNSNAPGKQGSGMEYNQQAKQDYGISYPILLDESGTVGLNFGANSTPQMFIVGEDRTVLYNGGADDTVLKTDKPGINYVINALTQQIAGEAIDPAITKHPGCSVKYVK